MPEKSDMEIAIEFYMQAEALVNLYRRRISKELKVLCKKLGQKEVAARLGVSVQYVSDLTRGNRQLSHPLIVKIAEAVKNA